MNASIDTLIRRIGYGGRKGRRASARLRRTAFRHPLGGVIHFDVHEREVTPLMSATVTVSTRTGSEAAPSWSAQMTDFTMAFDWNPLRRDARDATTPSARTGE